MPPHGTTPAAVITNENKKVQVGKDQEKDPLRAVSIFSRKVMGHTAVSIFIADLLPLSVK